MLAAKRDMFADRLCTKDDDEADNQSVEVQELQASKYLEPEVVGKNLATDVYRLKPHGLQSSLDFIASRVVICLQRIDDAKKRGSKTRRMLEQTGLLSVALTMRC